MQPFSLNDVFTLDTPYIRKTGVSLPPAAYPWWPFRGFGLRDSNLSPDFPTSAQLSLHQLALEGGPDAQGVVAVTAPVIADVAGCRWPDRGPRIPRDSDGAEHGRRWCAATPRAPPPGRVPITNSSCS